MEINRFFQFSLFIGSYRGLRFGDCYRLFLFIFKVFLTTFSSFLLKYVTIVNFSVVDFFSKYKGVLLNCLIQVLWLEDMLNFSKFRLFSSNMGTHLLFSPLVSKFQEVNTLKLKPYTS